MSDAHSKCVSFHNVASRFPLLTRMIVHFFCVAVQNVSFDYVVGVANKMRKNELPPSKRTSYTIIQCSCVDLAKRRCQSPPAQRKPHVEANRFEHFHFKLDFLIKIVLMREFLFGHTPAGKQIRSVLCPILFSKRRCVPPMREVKNRTVHNFVRNFINFELNPQQRFD